MNNVRTNRYLAGLVVTTCLVLGTSVASAQPGSGFGGSGWIFRSGTGPSALVLTGNAAGIGKYFCFGQLVLVTDSNGATSGSGVAVFIAKNGDLLAGVVTLNVAPGAAGDISFSWRDSVIFPNGSVVPTTGRFIKKRPPGASSKFQGSPFGGPNGIIAILIG